MGENIFQISDIVPNILAQINDGVTYKTARLVCRSWFFAVGDRINEFSNHLWTLITKLPHKKWSWYLVLTNPLTKIERILDPDTLVIRQEIWDLIEMSNGHYKINDFGIYVKAPLTGYKIYLYLLENPNVIPYIDRLSTYITKEEKYRSLGRNPKITWDMILSLSFSEKAIWNIEELSRNPVITWDIVTRFPNMDWDWQGISEKPSITWQTIVDNPQYPWDWVGISHNPNITWDIVLANPTKDWFLEGIFTNQNLNEELLKDHPKYYLYKRISLRYKSQEEIKTYIPLAKLNEMAYISRNRNLTWRNVIENQQCLWDYEDLSKNTFSKHFTNIYWYYHWDVFI